MINECVNLSAIGITSITKHCPKLEHLEAKRTEFSGSIVNTCPRLRLLNLQACKQLKDDGLRLLSENCPELEDIDLSYCDEITDTSIKVLCRNCKNLQRCVSKG